MNNDLLDTFHDLPILIEQSFNEDRGGYILPTEKFNFKKIQILDN